MARDELRKNVKFYFANKKIKKEEKLNRPSELLFGLFKIDISARGALVLNQLMSGCGRK